jgi:integrase
MSSANGHLSPEDSLAFLYQPNARELETLGYGAIAKVPVLFGASGQYLRIENRYLRERAMLEWYPEKMLGSSRQSSSYPRFKTLLQIANELLNFHKFLELSNVHWEDAEFDPTITSYRSMQNDGKWSKNGRPLAGSTTNGRVAVAADFLEWAAERGLRKPIAVPRIKVQAPSHYTSFPKSKRVTGTPASAIVGGVREQPANLHLPTPAEIQLWLQSISARWGYTKFLAAKTCLEVALRRLELTSLTTEFAPRNPTDWDTNGDFMMLEIVNGTKGGKSRLVTVPVSLVVELHKYREGRRLKALAKLIRRDASAERPDALFLSEHDGSPLSYYSLYECWTKEVDLPFRGWSPHLGRHAWACYTLLDHIGLCSRQYNLDEKSLPAPWVDSIFKSGITMIIQPQLGHQSARTTEGYLQWVNAHLIMPRIYETWHAWLES